MINRYTIKVFFNSLFNYRKEYKKQMNRFCETFHDEGLSDALVFKFKVDKDKADRIIINGKKLLGYDASSLAAEEDYRVKRFCFDMFYFKIAK